MKIKNKYCLLLEILLTIFIIIVILLNGNLENSSEISLMENIPIIYWILISLNILIIIYNTINSNNKYIIIFNTLLFFFTLFSFILFFKISITQSDIHFISNFISFLSNTNYIKISDITYYEYPIFFIYTYIFSNVLGIYSYNIININLIILIIILPLSLYLMNNNIKVYFINSTIFILFSFFFLNTQFVPQFLGLIFLFYTFSTFSYYIKTKNIKILVLIYVFFIFCIYTHPFIFIFFILSLIIIKVLKYYNMLVRNNKFKIFLNISELKNYKFSMFPLIMIYLISLYFRFKHIHYHLSQSYKYSTEKGETWKVLKNLTGNSATIEKLNYSTYPLYNLVSNNFHFVIRNINILLLLLLILLIIFSIFKTNKKHRKVFDFSIFISTLLFFVLGFYSPFILGQRSLQISFLQIPKYLRNILKNKKFVILISMLVILSINTFIINSILTSNLVGNPFLEDKYTLNSSIFIEENININETVIISNEYYYPTDTENGSNLYITPLTIVSDVNIDINNYTIILYSEKLNNNLNYYNINLDIFENTSIVYDISKSKIYINY